MMHFGTCISTGGLARAEKPHLSLSPQSRVLSPAHNMNWADYCIIGILALSVLMGLWRGFIGEVLALACWVVAFWVAWVFGPRLAESFTAIDAPSVRLLLGYGICLLPY